MQETFIRDAAAELTLYFAIRNADGDWLDFDDWTFKALGEVAEVALPATEQDLSAERSRYSASIDLADLAPGLAAVECLVACYEQAGEAPSPLDDALSGRIVPLVAQLGQKGRRQYVTRCHLGATTTSGTELELMSWLEADGRKVPLHDLDDNATCAVVITRRGNYPQLTIDTTEMGAVNADHCFEPTYADPDFTADRIYRAEAIITAQGLTFDANLKAFAVVP